MNQKATDVFFHSSKDTQVVLNQLAAMPRQKETLIDEIESRLSHKLSRRDIVAVFKALDTCGAGELIEGCVEHPSRFRWS
jgi:hypothetical protein